MLDLESLFKLTYGMFIISSTKGEKFNGCIVNTVFQLTPEPPMVAVSLNKKSLTHSYISDSGFFGVSILSEETPISVVRNFGFRSGRDCDKFAGVKCHHGEFGTKIVLDNTVGYLEAEVCKKIDIGSHTLFIAEIRSCQSINAEKVPMSYAYYRDKKQGKTPKSAATYIATNLSKKTNKGENKMEKYECKVCGYIYDPEFGDPGNGVEGGTAFSDLPDDWVCPECGAGKEEFELVSE